MIILSIYVHIRQGFFYFLLWGDMYYKKKADVPWTKVFKELQKSPCIMRK